MSDTPGPVAGADLQRLRESIEEVDRELLAQLKRRMDLVEHIAASKLEMASPFRDPPREERVLQRVRALAVEAGLDSHAIEQLYRGIMEMSIAHQQAHIHALPTTPLRIAYQGVEGSYSHLAARQRFQGREGGVLLSGRETFRQAAEDVLHGRCDLAFLPIENTTAGSINEVYDLLAEGGLTIVGEVISHIQHCLLALPGVELEELRTIISHPQALLQSESFLRSLPGVRTRAEFDTGGAARIVAESGDRTLGALASESAAQVFGLSILRRHIQSQAGNYTRFVQVSREASPCPADAPCKTSLLVAVSHEPGALGRILTAFAQRGINLSKLESRPVPDNPWNYRFYLDVHAHANSAEMSGLLREIEPLTSDLRVLGSYPRAARAAAPNPETEPVPEPPNTNTATTDTANPDTEETR